VSRPAPDPRNRAAESQARHDVYDAYPDHELPPPRVRLALVAVLEGATEFDAEFVDTDGYSVREWLPGALEHPKRAHWLVTRLDEAHRRLVERIGPAADE